MMFSLQTVNLKDVKAWDKPACYKLSVTVSFKLIIKNMIVWESMFVCLVGASSHRTAEGD